MESTISPPSAQFQLSVTCSRPRPLGSVTNVQNVRNQIRREQTDQNSSRSKAVARLLAWKPDEDIANWREPRVGTSSAEGTGHIRTSGVYQESEPAVPRVSFCAFVRFGGPAGWLLTEGGGRTRSRYGRWKAQQAAKEERRKLRAERRARGEDVSEDEDNVDEPPDESLIMTLGKLLLFTLIAFALAGQFITGSPLWGYKGKWTNIHTYLAPFTVSSPICIGSPCA
jgi:hypothetical protein